MPTTRKVASIAFAGATASATLALAMNPALAVNGIWYIKAADALFHGTVTGKNKGTIKFHDVTHPVTVTCTSVTGSGSAPHSKVTGTPARLGTIKKASLSHCSFLGVTFRGHLTQAASVFGSTYKNGATKGRIRHLHAVWSGVGNNCQLSGSGSLPGSYKNASHTLIADPAGQATMTITHENVGCPIVKQGDKFDVQGTFPVGRPKSLTASDP